MGCNPPGYQNSQAYAQQAGAPIRLFTDVGTLEMIAARNGAQSQDFTMCLTVAFLLTQRVLYWKATPGDCGNPRTFLLNPGSQLTAAGAGIAAGGASVDPEPVSKGILAGLASIFGAFGAAHAKAVQTEQSTLCDVALKYNSTAQTLEAAIQSGQLSADQAASILSQEIAKLDPELAAIAKPVNAAAGFRIALRALLDFNESIVFPALVPAVPLGIAPAPIASPGAPGTGPSGPASFTPGPVSPFGPDPRTLTGNPSSGIGLPFSLTPGTVVLIGGVAYVASKL